MATEASEATVARIDLAAYEGGDYQPFRFQEWEREAQDVDRIERDKERVDPILLDVVEGGLEAAIVEGEAAVERTGRSTIIREQHDFRASINTVQCDSVTHVSWGATADPIRAHFPLEQIDEGDVFIYNDVYDSHGTITHLPDYCVVVPVFSGGRIIAFTQIFGHTQDVGGRVLGSWPITSRSIFEDGVQVPPVKLYARGELREDVYKIILRNSRFPDDERGDIDAFVGAARVMEKRIVELCERIGTDLVEAAMYKLIDRCADAVRNVILPKFPDGEWVGEDFVDNDGVNLDEPVKLKLVMRKDSEQIVLDWGQSNPQTEGCINWPIGGRMLSKWIGAMLKQFVPGLVINEGVTQVLRNYVRQGTVLAPDYPAGVANRMQPKMRCLGAYGTCLAQAFEGEVVADMHCIQLYGFYGVDQDGVPFIAREVFGAGSGARPYADGTDAVDLVANAKNIPTEFMEQRYPLVIERVGLHHDSGGPGRHRGGLGYRKEIRVLVEGDFLTNVDRTMFQCFGVAGGLAGLPGGATVNPGTPDERHYTSSREAIPVRAGDLVRVVTPGGGGHGDPLEREVEAVRLDVLRGFVSIEAAERDYGVIVRAVQDGRIVDVEVDEEATRARRAAIAQEREALSLIERGEHARKLKAAGVIDYEEHPLAVT